MKKNLKIMVTGAGGAVGIGLVKSLRKEFGKKIKIIGTDSSVYAPPFYMPGFLDDFFVAEKASAGNYIANILKAAKDKRIDLIFPGTDHEILPLAENEENFRKEGIKVIVSSPKTIKICNDKWLTYESLKNSLPIVESFIKVADINSFPVVVKPRFGWGSRDIYKGDAKEEAEIFFKKIENPVAQRWLSGTEYTVDGLVSLQGKVLCIVPRQRISVLAGVSSLGVTIQDDKLIKLGYKLAKNLRIKGPFNFQVRREGKNYWIFEINSRFAGTGILSVESGINIPALAVKDFLGMKIPDKLNFKPGIFITRFVEDIFIK
jgi:carbamoyl-phosphate synthase large subunit